MTLIQDLEIRKAKIEQAIQLLREAGLVEFQNGYVPQINGEGVPGKRTLSAESKAVIGEKMRKRWAEKKAQGKLMNPNQVPKKPLVIPAVAAGNFEG